MTAKGTVYLVGAGPGDPELLTLKALRLIQTADVVVYDRLVSQDILDLIPSGAAKVDVGKRPNDHPVPQPDINRLLVRLAEGGNAVVRLKGGDPFMFGRGGEELMELVARGFTVEVVPGVTSAQGCAASAGIPLTHRGYASGVRYITGHCRANVDLDFDWQGLADPKTTLVVYMGLANIGQVASRLIAHGMPGALPVMAIANGTRSDEQRIVATLQDIAVTLRSYRLAGPVLFVIGEVVALATHAQVREVVGADVLLAQHA